MSLLWICFLCSYLFRSYAHRSLPNIIFVLVDDLGWNDVSFHDGSDFQTPTIDSLAKRGLQLDNYYIQSFCTPTRSALMSGRYPIHTGLQDGSISASSPYGLPLDLTLIPQDLKRAGYDTHMMGKWHLGFFADEYLPTSRGFDTFLGFYGGEEDYYNHNYSDGECSGYDLRKQAKSIMRVGEYSTYMYGNATMDILKEYDNGPSKTNPFFMYMAVQAIHSPQQAPQHIIDSLAETIADTNRSTVAAMIIVLDDVIGQLVHFMKNKSKKKIWDNLLFIFSTDNGGPVPLSSSNFPLRGSKGTLWEGGVKGVGFVAGGWLDNNRKKTSMNALMHITDWYPTLCDIAGVTPSNISLLDGYSQLSNIQEGVSDIYSPRSEILLNIDPVCTTVICGALRFGKFKLVVGDQVTSTDEDCLSNWCPLFDGNTDGTTIQCSTDGNSKYPNMNGAYIANNCPYNNEPCLFNIEEDPCEYYDLNDELPENFQRMYDRLLHYNSTMVPALSLLFPEDETSADPHELGGFWGPWVYDSHKFWGSWGNGLKKDWLHHLMKNMAVILL